MVFKALAREISPTIIYIISGFLVVYTIYVFSLFRTRKNGRKRRWRNKDWVTLQIIDEGEGIPESELESVFDKFYRAQKGDHVRPGTGLGLAISRGFVEAMHGTISATNRTDRSGAMLTIRLPIPTDNMTFSSEVDAGSPEENASEQKTLAAVLMQSEPKL